MEKSESGKEKWVVLGATTEIDEESDASIWAKSILGRVNSKFKSPESGECLALTGAGRKFR